MPFNREEISERRASLRASTYFQRARFRESHGPSRDESQPLGPPGPFFRAYLTLGLINALASGHLCAIAVYGLASLATGHYQRSEPDELIVRKVEQPQTLRQKIIEQNQQDFSVKFPPLKLTRSLSFEKENSRSRIFKNY